MSEHEISRRTAVTVLGASAAALGVGSADSRPPAATDDGGTPRTRVEALLQPLTLGSAIGRWTVEELREVEDGAATLVLRDRRGELFQLDVCARDPSPSAERGPAVTEHFELFLANTGDGRTATHEDHGLAAMAIAEVIRGNEQGSGRSGYLTLAERVSTRSVRRHLA